ncbi:MAG: AAA family ATPase [Anaerolineales bacterium]|nr:AAA family ATPase [Anaerolineales bacterium]
MNALYITSVEPYSGKTAVCLALGKQLQSDGRKVGYLKPVSTQPWRTPEGKLADEDAVFVHKVLGLEGDPTEAAPVIVTPSTLRKRLKGTSEEDLMQKIQHAAEAAAKGKDILLLEGLASLREGYAMGLSNLKVAESIGSPALVIVSFSGEMRLVDDALTAQFRLGELLCGVILNRVPQESQEFVDDYACPFLEKQGIRVLGTLPRVPRLSALSIGELIDLLQAEVLTKYVKPNALVETFTVGAMTADAALSRFRRYQNKAVITGGDRTDIQLAALETSTVVLILTGNLRPSPLIIQQAEALDVPILLVKDNTMETVDHIERAHGKTRLGQPEKLETFIQLMAENVDIGALYDFCVGG